MNIIRYIRGEYFNTRTATKIVSIEDGKEETYYIETLYKKTDSTKDKERKYNYFLLCSGNSLSKYANPPYNGEATKNKLLPLTLEGAETWLKAKNVFDRFERSLELESPETEAFTISIAEELLEKYELYRRRKKISIIKFFENSIAEIISMDKKSRFIRYESVKDKYDKHNKIRKGNRIRCSQKAFFSEEAKESNLFINDIIIALIDIYIENEN